MPEQSGDDASLHRLPQFAQGVIQLALGGLVLPAVVVAPRLTVPGA